MSEDWSRGHLYGEMVVIATDQGAHRRYLCACGWRGWSVWGHARKHAEKCPRSGEVPTGWKKSSG
jgi:hypothetical protein